MQDRTQQRIVNLDVPVLVDETQLAELVHERLTRDRVVPIISASVSWLMFGLIGCGLPAFPNFASSSSMRSPLARIEEALQQAVMKQYASEKSVRVRSRTYWNFIDAPYSGSSRCKHTPKRVIVDHGWFMPSARFCPASSSASSLMSTCRSDSSRASARRFWASLDFPGGCIFLYYVPFHVWIYGFAVTAFSALEKAVTENGEARDEVEPSHVQFASWTHWFERKSEPGG
jgi:hypothetical protein